MLKMTKSTNALAPVLIKANVDEVINSNSLKFNLFKSKKIKLTNFKNLTKSKNYINIKIGF